MIDQHNAMSAYLRQVGISPRTTSGTTPAEVLSAPPPARVAPAGDLPDYLRALLGQPAPIGERSDRIHHLVGVCKRAGLDEGQTVTVLEPWCAMVSDQDGKYTGKAAHHVRLSWSKIPDAEHDTYLRQRKATAATGHDLGQGDQGHDLGQDSDPDDAEPGQGDAPNTWERQPLDTYLDGTYRPEVATLLQRDDGIGLLYPGHTHSIHADSESGKSLIMQAEVSHQLNQGQWVAYLDFESDAASVVRRLIDLGTDPEAIRQRFDYIRPEVAPAAGTPERAAWLALLQRRYALVVLDGVTEAMDVLASRTPGQDLNERIASFLRRYPTLLAMRTGAAVVLIDHVVKSTETRGRHAIGGQHKLNGLSGAAYTVEVKTQPRRGHVGEIRLYVAKDRPGGVRANCPPPRTDRLQLAAVVRIDSTTDRLQVTISAPDAEPDTSAAFRPTFLMERVSRWLEAHPGEHSRSAVTQAVQGKKSGKETALDVLADEGYATVSETSRGTIRQRNYAHLRLFSEAEDLAEPKPVPPVPNRSQTGPGTSTGQTGPTGPTPLLGGPVDGTGLGTTADPPDTGQTGPGLVRSHDAPPERPCEHCQHPLSLSALSCPACGELAEEPF